MIRARLPVLVGLMLVACGGAAQPAPTPAPTVTASPRVTATPIPAPSVTPAPSAVSSGITFTLATGSKAVVQVTEQLADRRDLSDAVLTSDKVSGEFTLGPDGTFASTSKIVVDLTALTSDNRTRDNFIKQETLETRRFPQAIFVPVRTEGLALPLPANGDLAFTLVGQMTVRGVTKEVAFDVKAKRGGTDLTATATVTPAMRFGTFGMTQPRVFSVLSIKDEIRLEVQLVAKQKI